MCMKTSVFPSIAGYTTHENAKEQTMDILLPQHDPAVSALILREWQRQEQELTLIASENYTWPDVLRANASPLTNKYAEGYPGKRYYAGCEVIDQVEQLAIDRCKALFGAAHANVQPHAGSQANMAAYLALLKPGDTIMGMSLAAGGHLTHGHAVNISGIVFKVVQYGVDPETELLDYDAIERLAHEHKPKLIICGASAYSRTIDFERFGRIARAVGAYLLADIAHIAGLVAAGIHPSPVPYADVTTSTTHKTLRGPRGGLIMGSAELGPVIDRAIIPGSQGGPMMHTIAAKAVAFGCAHTNAFKEYQRQIVQNAQALASHLHHAGLRIVAGGTDNHLFTVDLRSQNITGLAAEHALNAAGIATSRSCIPNDPQKPWITSGVRLGTPAATARGLKEDDMALVAEYILSALAHHTDETQLARIKSAVRDLCTKFPVYPHGI